MGFSTRIGKYELGRALGEGAFSKVKVARNIETGHNFAVKIIDKQMVVRNNLIDQVKREISAMKLARHPNVVRLYEVLASKKRIYLVMEYVAGGELSDRLAYMGKIDEDEARKYFHQLIDAVDYCHSRGVYHRDLKPHNLLLDGKGKLKVSDFGLSALHKADALLSTSCGSPYYVAPEVIVDKNYDGAAADVWSCGVILFELLAGFCPFEDVNLFDAYQKVCNGEISYPPWFSYGAQNLITNILDPSPNSRISILKIYEDSWFKEGYSPVELQTDEENISLDDMKEIANNTIENLVTKEKHPIFINAFQLIAMSNELDLSRFFEKENGNITKKRFISQNSTNQTIEKIETMAKALGFLVERKNNYKMRLQSKDKEGEKKTSYLSMSIEVIEVVPCICMVAIWKYTGEITNYINVYKLLSNNLSGLPEIPKV